MPHDIIYAIILFTLMKNYFRKDILLNNINLSLQIFRRQPYIFEHLLECRLLQLPQLALIVA